MSAANGVVDPPGFGKERKFAGGHVLLERLPNGELSFRCLPFDSQTGYRLSIPHEFESDPWAWFQEEGHLGATPDTEFMQACRAEAYALGYRLLLDDLINEPDGYRWESAAAPLAGHVARPLAWAVLRGQALEEGLEIIKRVVKEGGDWPAEPVRGLR